jgi:hypothetical protein
MKATIGPAVVALVAVGSTAHAQEIDLVGPLPRQTDEVPRASREIGVGEAEMDARFLRVTVPGPSSFSNLGEIGLAGRLVYGDRVGFAGGADLAIGASDRGVAGDAVLYPIGLGLALGSTGFGAIMAGGGAGGWGAAPAGMELPVDARIAFDVGTHVRLTFDARVTWVPFVPSREGGAPHVPFCDEALFGITTRVGHLWEHRNFRDAGGYFFRLEHAEMLGTSFLGLAIGYQMAGSG